MDDDITEPPPRPYGTRTSNDPHPARSAGLEKRTIGEIEEEAAAKRAAKEQKAAERQDAAEAQEHRQNEGVLKVRAMLQRWGEKEKMETQELRKQAAREPVIMQRKSARVSKRKWDKLSL